MPKIPGLVTREQVQQVRDFVGQHGVSAIACMASQIADGPDAGQWIGMGCELEDQVFKQCFFTTQPVLYATQGRASQGAMALLAGILAGVDEVIDKEG